MKLFDCDWSGMAQVAPLWDRLPVECKRFFLTYADANRRVDLDSVNIDCAPLVEEGFLEVTRDSGQLLLPKGLVPFRRVVRAMDRLAVFSPDPVDRPALVEYISEHFSREDQDALCGSLYGYGDCRRKLAAQLGRQNWPRRFLAENDFVQWETSYRSDRRTPLFYNEVVFRKAKEILEDLLEDVVNPRSLCDLADSHGRQSPLCFGGAVRGLVGFGLVFPGFSYPDMALAVGVWPAIHNRMRRKAPMPPAPVTPTHQSSIAFLIHDMTTLLVACLAEPVRLRANDGALFAKTARDVEARLLPLPDWLTTAVTYTTENRLRRARVALLQMEFCNTDGIPGKGMSLVASEKGRQWLGLSDAERLRYVLDQMYEELNTELPRYYGYDLDTLERFPCFERMPRILDKGVLLDVRKVGIDAFADSRAHEPIRLADFAQYQAETANPYIRVQESGSVLSTPDDWIDGFGLDDSELVDSWRDMLTWFFVDRLVPLGCVSVGTAEDGHLTFSLTEIGRYLAGDADGFAYGDTERQDIVVQPNFEVVFLSRSPLAEAAVAHMAERVGSGLGVLFKITRSSVYEAIAGGLEAKAILERLTTLSSKPIPKNVARQIMDWAGQCRKIHVSSAVLMECPDRETALRVRSVGGKKLRLISDTIVALTDRKALKGIEKKLRKNGITRK